MRSISAACVLRYRSVLLRGLSFQSILIACVVVMFPMSTMTSSLLLVVSSLYRPAA